MVRSPSLAVTLALVAGLAALVTEADIDGINSAFAANAASLGAGHETPRNRARQQPAEVTPSDAVIDALRAYAAAFARELTFVVAREHYEQEVRSLRGSFGATAGVVVARRTTEAEVAFASIADGMWIMTRRVSLVDGRAVEPPPSPLEDVKTEADALARMRKLADENARWNIGRIIRNVNTPTLPLWFLTEPIVERFRLSLGGHETLAAGPCRIVRFLETARPTIVKGDGVDAPASGRFWVLDSGAVVRTRLNFEPPSSVGNRASPAASVTTTVDYAYSPTLGFWVPATMNERYDLNRREGERITGKATYSDYRRFQVDVKIKEP